MNLKRLIVSLTLPQAAGALGAYFTSAAIATWYVTLEKPVFNPPNWLFGPVWLVLYVLMGLAIYGVWQSKKEGVTKRRAMTTFWIHLLLNAIWPIVFFSLKNLGLALVNIILVWSMIIVLIVQFWKIDRRSSYLLMPYLVWVSYATTLNAWIWVVN